MKNKTHGDFPKPSCLELRLTCAGTSFEPFQRRTSHFRHFRSQTGISPSSCFWLHSSLSLLTDVDQTHLDTIRNGTGLLLASRRSDVCQRRKLASWKNLWTFVKFGEILLKIFIHIIFRKVFLLAEVTSWWSNTVYSCRPWRKVLHFRENDVAIVVRPVWDERHFSTIYNSSKEDFQLII